MEKLKATESRIRGSSRSTGNKWSQKRTILVLHTYDITVGGGLQGIEVTVCEKLHFILRITFSSQGWWLSTFMFHYRSKSMELNITACTRKLLIVHTVVFIVPHGCLNRRVTWCSLLFESLTYAKYCSSCVTISYSAEYKRLWSWAGSGFAACGFISDSVDNMFYWFLFFLLDHLTTT